MTIKEFTARSYGRVKHKRETTILSLNKKENLWYVSAPFVNDSVFFSTKDAKLFIDDLLASIE